VRVEEALFADALVHGEVKLLDGGLGLGPRAGFRIGGSGGGWGRGFFLLGGYEDGKGGEEKERGKTSRAGVHLRVVPPEEQQGTGDETGYGGQGTGKAALGVQRSAFGINRRQETGDRRR
jgi:hypothetical protein